jgi:hypothetical protein
MKLFTQKILNELPDLYANEDVPNNEIKVPLKLFNAFGNQRWYVTEYDPSENVGFGFANLGDDLNAELGYISIDELIAVKHPMFKLERDIYWDGNTTLDKVMSFEVR